MQIKLGQVLKEARLQKGFTQTQVAERAGISHPYYNLIENEKSSRPPSFYVIEKIARILGCNAKPLLKTVELMQLEHKRENVKIMEKRLGQKPPKSRPIPILSEIPADTPREVTDQDYPPGIAEDYYEFKVDDPNAFFLKAKGDCMSPEIKNGDLLLIYPTQNNPENGDIFVVKNNKSQQEVRRITNEPDQIILTADNPIYPVIIWRKDRDEPVIIGRVKEIIRRR